MPKLIKDYQRTGEQRPFRMDKIRRSSERGILDDGLGRLRLTERLDALVRKGLIEENSWRRISISDAGIGWKDEMT